MATRTQLKLAAAAAAAALLAAACGAPTATSPQPTAPAAPPAEMPEPDPPAAQPSIPEPPPPPSGPPPKLNPAAISEDDAVRLFLGIPNSSARFHEPSSVFLVGFAGWWPIGGSATLDGSTPAAESGPAAEMVAQALADAGLTQVSRVDALSSFSVSLYLGKFAAPHVADRALYAHVFRVFGDFNPDEAASALDNHPLIRYACHIYCEDPAPAYATVPDDELVPYHRDDYYEGQTTDCVAVTYGYIKDHLFFNYAEEIEDPLATITEALSTADIEFESITVRKASYSKALLWELKLPGSDIVRYQVKLHGFQGDIRDLTFWDLPPEAYALTFSNTCAPSVGGLKHSARVRRFNDAGARDVFGDDFILHPPERFSRLPRLLISPDPPQTPAQPPLEPLTLEPFTFEPEVEYPDPANACERTLSYVSAHYPNRLVIRYKSPIINAEEGELWPPVSRYPEAAALIAADLASLEGNFDIRNVSVTYISINGEHFVMADGNFNPVEVSRALCKLDKIEYALPDEIVVSD